MNFIFAVFLSLTSYAADSSSPKTFSGDLSKSAAAVDATAAQTCTEACNPNSTNCDRHCKADRHGVVRAALGSTESPPKPGTGSKEAK